jgi:DNA-binding beta-propeller fold protein YncE
MISSSGILSTGDGALLVYDKADIAVSVNSISIGPTAKDVKFTPDGKLVIVAIAGSSVGRD